VELWRSDSYIKADRLNGSTKNRTFQAEGNVRSDVGAVRATSDRLNYDDAGETAHYIGNVKAQRKNLRLEAADMTAKVSGGQLSDIVAQGGVVVTQGDRRGTGDSAVYNAKTEEVVLTGQQAEVTDPREGTVRGTRLTMNNGGDRIQVETGQGGRVTSKLKVRQ
jgi:lipopolysaccharide transport protein LptA